MSFKSYDEYFSYFKRLIFLERKAEMDFHRREIRNLSGEKREKLGRAILNLKGKLIGRGLGGTYIVKYVRKDGLPDTQINVGDLVIASKGKPKGNEIQGTVIEKRKFSLTVAYNKPPPNYALGERVRIDLFANDITFQRMLDALEILRNNESLTSLLLGKIKPKISIKELEISNKSLNDSQRIVVYKALASYPIFLIHGPPGTGKTTTLVEIIYQYIKSGLKVLATADSNVAVDNLVEKLVKYNINVVRVGNPARITKTIVENSLSYLLQYEEDYRRSLEIYEMIDTLRKEQDRYLQPSPRWRRGLTDEQIMRYAKTGTPVRGIHPNNIRSMAKWIEIQREINSLFNKAKELENKAVKRILKNAEVVCATNSTAGSEVLSDFTFDIVVIDEATQSTEPSCLIPMVKGRMWIMAGDHKQLPPTVLSKEAYKYLQITLFERLLRMYGDDIMDILRVQYRMNEKIMEFINEEFYDGKLIAYETIKNRTLRDLGIDEGKITRFPYPYNVILDPDKPLIFIDTCGKYPENQFRGSTSYYNRGEAILVKEIVVKILSLGVKPSHIGVISPYDDQIGLIHKFLEGSGIHSVEVKTVDGFQGREKEIMIISFVRSNDKRDIGFLNDTRRLNVSLTRAKVKLITIGDSKTLSVHETFKKFIEFSKKYGGYTIIHSER